MGDSPKSPRRQAKSALPASEVVLDAVGAALTRLPEPPDGPLRLCVGLSGGIDSVVLLHALCRVRAGAGRDFELSALHVHHGLSPHADAWAAFCSELCRTWEVECTVHHVTVPAQSGEGLEGAARRMRHAAFADIAAHWVVLAQHRGDQAETLLLNLLRGAGVAGAAAMPETRPGRSGAPGLLRPLLGVPRASLLAYAQGQALRWIEDESNADTSLRRNYLRHEVLPRLSAVFPGSEVALARACSRFAEAESLLEDLARLDDAYVRTAAGRVDVAACNALPPARARNLFRFLWRAAGFRATEQRWIDEALAQLACARPGAEICVATAEAEVHVYRGELYLLPLPVQPPAACVWQGEAVLPWGMGRVRFNSVAQGGIAPQLLASGNVRLQCRQGGELLRLAPGRARRKIRNLLQEAAIPPWVRPHMPYLWLGEELAWVGGIGLDAQFAGGAGILPVWETGAPV